MELKTPLRIVEASDGLSFFIEDDDGKTVADDGSASGEYGKKMTKEVAREIVACVNACAGRHTAELEHMNTAACSEGLGGAVGILIDRANRQVAGLQQQRDSLLTASKALVNDIEITYRAGSLAGYHPDSDDVRTMRAAVEAK